MLRLPLPLVSFLSGGLIYAVAGAIGLWMMGIAEGVPAFWPANGLLVAAVLTFGIRQIAWVLAGALVGSFFIQLAIDAGAMGVAITLSDLAEVALVAYAAHRLRVAGSGLESIFSVVALVAVISFGAALSATGAAVALNVFRDIPLGNSLSMLWRLNATSALIILAPYFAIVKPGRMTQLRDLGRRGERGGGRDLEFAALLLLVVIAILLMQWTGISMIAFFTAPLLWCAIRFGPAPTALIGSLLSLAIILLIVNGAWPTTYANTSIAWQLQRTELGLSFNTLPPLFVAAAMAHIQASARALKLSQERLRYALAGSGEGVWDWNIRTNETYFSDSWYAILGYERGELPETTETWEQLRHPDDRTENRRRIGDHLEGRTPRYSIEQRFRHKDGRWIWVLDRGSIVERDADGSPLRAVGTLLDISRRRARQDELNRRAHHDSLTGLANRVALRESFQAWCEARRSFCFVLIDLDGFKPINDQFGHQFGDHALVAIADRIRACLGPDDVAARIGGDEFALLVELSGDEAEAMAQRLVERISEPIGFAEAVVSTGASIGIATVEDGGLDFQTAYRNADIALYDAKAIGGSTFRRGGANNPARNGEEQPTPAVRRNLGTLALAGSEPADDPAEDRQDTTDERHG
ncbi:diguanylate cyclase domain-containing protein [Kaistia adipata]|uniref:diguanylate cyclase domain-containing protein n=1 Tax=Kaistia adipata TaxID=166954 RepID=UPI0004113FC1|nr:diguanylate cyclase [Kaistia adipata]